MYYKQLTSEQRYYIEVSLQNGKDKKEIADAIDVHISTIYRELKRNKGKYDYYHNLAQRKCDERKQRMRKPRTLNLGMRKRIFSLMTDEQWSPEQIKGYMERHAERCACVETLYSYIRFDRRSGGTLWTHCRHKLKNIHRQVSSKYTAIKDRKMIDERPKEVDGKRFGDWEMDCIIGRLEQSIIVTLVEKSTNFMIMKRLANGKNAKALARTVVDMLIPFKKHVKTITTDNGSEFADFKYIEMRLNTSVYFAHPYSSWEKGAIENTNKLIRQYIPKQTDFNRFNHEAISQIQYKINRRPRKKLDFQSPKHNFFQMIDYFRTC